MANEAGYDASKTASKQGSVLLFNIYISDLPIAVSRKYVYADDLAIIYAIGEWQAVEEVLSKEMATVDELFQTD